MNKHAFPLLIAIGMMASTQLFAARHYQQDSDSNGMMKRMCENVEMMRYEISNHEAELRTMGEKIRNQEETIQQLRQELEMARKESYEQLKGADSSTETSFKTVSTDLRKLKSHANESSDMMGKYQGWIKKLEDKIAKQNSDIDHMQQALRSLMEILQPNDVIADNSGKVYRVREGDSLGLIAQRHRITVKEIKELNNLKSDRILIGQSLKIPER